MELEVTMYCENCGATCRLMYDGEEVTYEPENCPFCGEVVGTITSEDCEDDTDEEEEDEDDNWD